MHFADPSIAVPLWFSLILFSSEPITSDWKTPGCSVYVCQCSGIIAVIFIFEIYQMASRALKRPFRHWEEKKEIMLLLLGKHIWWFTFWNLNHYQRFIPRWFSKKKLGSTAESVSSNSQAGSCREAGRLCGGEGRLWLLHPLSRDMSTEGWDKPL